MATRDWYNACGIKLDNPLNVLRGRTIDNIRLTLSKKLYQKNCCLEHSGRLRGIEDK